jgi:hypothetical protein
MHFEKCGMAFVKEGEKQTFAASARLAGAKNSSSRSSDREISVFLQDAAA